jgi:hypothetical protein
MFKDFKKNTGNIFAEDLKDNNFDPSTIPNYSSNLDSSLASNSTLSIASLTKLFGLKVRTPLQLPRKTLVIPILLDTPETSKTEINEELS